MAELISKTSAAVVVSDELTTLLDWVNIEQVSGFTIIVENAGGGSGDNITDIQIDTSNDGGITASLDQHPGVPAVPIASGSAKAATFTEAAKFLRVRATCAAEDDTTARAVLLADSSIGRICTLADVKDRLGKNTSETEFDGTLNRIILGIEVLFVGYTRRRLLQTAAAVTEYYTAEGSKLLLKSYPIIAIISIKQAADYNFDAATALVANTDYRLINSGKNGIIYSTLGFGYWLQAEEAIEIVYRGGFCAAGQVPAAGETAMPADLREAAIEQATFIFKRKDDIGLSGVSMQGGSISKFSDMELLPLVKQVLDNYKRPSL